LPDERIEDEFERLLTQSGILERGRKAVARRLGWDGHGGTTLEAAANGELTRERVRQLETRLAETVSKSKDRFPAIEAALGVLAERAPLTRTRAAEVLREEGLARTLVDPAGIISAGRMAGIPLEVEIKGACVYGPFQQAAVAQILEVCRKIVTTSGA